MDMIKKGEPFPDFKLPDENGNLVHLYSELKKGPVVVFFYPKDNTRGCTKEACEFRDSYAVFNSMNASVLGISADNQHSHKKFKNQHNLNFPLLTDKAGKFRKSLGIKSMLFDLIPDRVTFVIGKSGEIIHVTNNQLNFKIHAQEAIEALQED